MSEPSPTIALDQMAPDLSGQVVTLSFFRFTRIRDKLWAFAQMGLSRRALARVPGLEFFKLMGAGTGEGFTPIPDTGAVALLATWPDADAARHGLNAEIFARYRRRAVETLTLCLSPLTARGAWSRQMPFAPAPCRTGGPIAALTRATLRPAILLKFWARVPRISAAIGTDPNVMFKAGVGEVPWFHQMTFSIWPDTASMAAFARADGPHARAIRAVREGNWFAEELYARFAVLDAVGSWGGHNPLTNWRLAAE